MHDSALLIPILMLAGCGALVSPGTADSNRLEKIAKIYLGGDPAGAVGPLEQYLAQYPQDQLAWTIFGNALEDLDQDDQARQAYDKALAINPRNFQAITGLGILHRKRGDYDAAMKAYLFAVEIDPNYAQAYSSMTTISLKQNNDAQALFYARKAYDLDPNDPVIAANLAVAYHYNNDFPNRDKFSGIAAQLGYQKLDVLKQIYAGQITVRD